MKQICLSLKNLPGFTLLEVLLTLSLFSFFMLIIQRQQIISVTRMVVGVNSIARIFSIKKHAQKFFEKMPSKPSPPKKVDAPLAEVTVRSFFSKVHGKSSLKDFKNDITVIKTEGTWRDGAEPSKIAMITFVIMPAEKKS